MCSFYAARGKEWANEWIPPSSQFGNDELDNIEDTQKEMNGAHLREKLVRRGTGRETRLDS